MHDAVIGGISGCFAQVVVWPLEYLKSLKQLPGLNTKISFPKLVMNDVTTNGLTNTIYKGLGVQSVFFFGRSAVRFGVYENLKTKIQDGNPDQKLTPTQNFMCGVGAGFAESIMAMTPAEVIKMETIRTRENTSSGTFQNIKNIYTKNGFLGFYRGVVPTTLRQVSTQAVSFTTYEKTKSMYEKYEYTKNKSAAFAGISGGVLAVLLNNPIDAIKSYKQGQSMFADKSMSYIGREIIKRHGIRGFYQGCLFRTIKIAPLHGITFYMYDLVKNRLHTT